LKKFSRNNIYRRCSRIHHFKLQYFIKGQKSLSKQWFLSWPRPVQKALTGCFSLYFKICNASLVEMLVLFFFFVVHQICICPTLLAPIVVFGSVYSTCHCCGNRPLGHPILRWKQAQVLQCFLRRLAMWLLFTGFLIEIPGIHFQYQKYSRDNVQTRTEVMKQCHRIPNC
jgi:hypothetical protein